MTGQVRPAEVSGPDGLILPGWLAIVCLPALPALTLILWSGPFRLASVYFLIVILIGWLAFGQGRWRGWQVRLRRLPGPAWLRLILLAYAAIIAEEVLVGTVASLGEGAWPALWGTRALQFITLNLFAFAGPIFALALLAPRLAGLPRYHLWLTGIWGLYAERVWATALVSPVAALVQAGPMIAVYSVILAPAILSLPPPRGPARLWHLPVGWAVMFLLALPAILVLGALRAAYPEAFPPCTLIPCGGGTGD